MSPLRLATRGSSLALRQSESVAARLRAGGIDVELLTIVTEGDVRAPDTAFGEGVFVSAIASALLAGTVDLGVHSAKDVPLEEDPRLSLAAFPERVDVRDALVTRDAPRAPAGALESLPEGAVVGTDSPRRTGFLLAARPDLRVVPLHGNVDGRLGRLDAGEVDALVLAMAGLERLGLGHRALPLDVATMAPAPGQGALAVQVLRGSDAESAVAGIDDATVRLCVAAERAVLEGSGGGCRAPVGAHAVVVGGDLQLLAAAVGVDGSKLRRLSRNFEVNDPLDLEAVLSGGRAIGRSLSAALGVTPSEPIR